MPEEKIAYGEGATPIRKELQSEKTDERATSKDITIPSHTSAEREVTVSGLPSLKGLDVTELEFDEKQRKLRYSIKGRTLADVVYEFLKSLKNKWFIVISLMIIIAFLVFDNLKTKNDVIHIFIFISFFAFFRFVLRWK